jgi:Stigma-specific protein, Stig1
MGRWGAGAAMVALVACGRSSLDDLGACDPTLGACAQPSPDGGLCSADTSSDPLNCGACGNACAAGQACERGTCTAPPACGPGCAACCNGLCTDTSTDPKSCGGCGNVCGPGVACVGGICQGTTGCNGGPLCGPTKSCCAAGCVDTQTDPNDCGRCGGVCAAGATCVAGTCVVPPTCNGGPACGTAQACCANGCTDTKTDPQHCGSCTNACPAGAKCASGACAVTCNGQTCQPGESCCGIACVDESRDWNNCGGCGHACAATEDCNAGACTPTEGPFHPTVNPTYLTPGVHVFTTIDVPAGITVYVAGDGPASGTLDLRATGTVAIHGIIDLSGGPGTQNTITSETTKTGRAGSGGNTGEPYASGVLSAACQFVAGTSGAGGLAIAGGTGDCPVVVTDQCTPIDSGNALVFAAPAATYGGGGGVFTGFRAYGAGGGGAAGGGPGSAGAPFSGEQDCSGASGGGGATGGAGGAGGGAPYDGTPGTLGVTQCPGTFGAPQAFVGGGGGGSIGVDAAADLAVTTTFQTGSGGGGASGDYLDRPVFGGTSGGGGGGGALRVSSRVSITLDGQLLANGGPGGDAVIGTPAPRCDPQPGAGGGGGSGGVVYLAAPVLQVAPAAVVSAVGGAGGQASVFAGSLGGGGDGGFGRIRISTTPGSCTLAGTFSPPLVSACAPTPLGQAGFAYVGVYPK